MRFNPFRRRPAQPLRNNTLGQPMAGFSMPARAELLGAEEDSAAPELDATQLMALAEFLQAAQPSGPSVREAVLNAPRRAPAMELTPEEEALTSRQARLNAMGGPIPSRRPAPGRNLEQGLLAAELADPAVQRRLRAARGTIEGLAGGTAMLTGLPLTFGEAALGGTAAGLGRVMPALETTAGAARARGSIDLLARLMSQGGNSAALRRMAQQLLSRTGY